MNRYNPTIANEEVFALPRAAFEGRIEVIESDDGLREACDYLLSQPFVGFDTETRPSFQAGVRNRTALLQLSAPDRCFLFRLCSMRLDKGIIKILESSATTKVGLAVEGDLRGLMELRRFRPAGFADLQSEAAAYGIEEKSLRKLSAIVCGVHVSKAQRLSNWESSVLTPAQQRYAATDAWICLEIYRKLKSGSL